MATNTNNKTAVTGALVDTVVLLNNELKNAEDSTVSLLKALTGVHPTAANSALIAQLLSAAARARATKRIDGEHRIIDSLTDPFSAALTLAALTRDERREHWNTLLSCEKPAACDIAGNDNGAFPQSWKTVQKEATGLNDLYQRTKDDYLYRLDEAKRVIDKAR